MSTVDWPVPAEYEYPPSFDSYDAEPCILLLGDGRKQLGNLLSFSEQALHCRFHGTQDDHPCDICVQDIHLLHLLRPVSIKREDAPFQKAGEASFAASEMYRFRIELQDGNLLAGETLSYVKSGVGIYLFQPKSGDLVVRRFVAGTAIRRFGAKQNAAQAEEAAKPQWVMKNPRLAAIFRNTPEEYPYKLEARYERVLNRMMELWQTPQFDMYMEDLLVDRRGGRQGFAPEIVAELLLLSDLHTRMVCANAANPNDPWGMEAARREMDSQKIEFSPTRLTKAVEAGDSATLGLMLRAGMNVNHIGEGGWTPLMVAAFNGKQELALMLIQSGASITARDQNGYSPIHWASMNGFLSVVDMLLVRGAPVNPMNNYGWTPLLHAASRGHLEVVKLLLRSRADPNVAENEGWTALHKAVVNGHLAVVEALLDAGANVCAEHKNGTTALALAIAKGQTEIRALLMKRGAR